MGNESRLVIRGARPVAVRISPRPAAFLRVGAAAATGNTIAIPAHQAGDLIVISAFRDGSTTAPSLPTVGAWTSSNSGGANACSGRVGYKIARHGSTTSGTWTNATSLTCIVYRGVDPKRPIGAATGTNGTASSVTYAALTLTVQDGTSAVVGFAGHVNTDTALETPPTGMTNRATNVGTAEIAAHDTPQTSSWSQQLVAVGGTAAGWRTAVLEIRARPATVTHSTWYISPSGTSGNTGSEASPWSVQHAAAGAGGSILPGDTVRCLAGTYDVQSLSIALSGLYGASITFRPATRTTRAHIRGVSASTGADDIQVNGNYVRLVGLELSRDWPEGERANSHTGGGAVWINQSQDGAEVLYCVVHDGDDGVFVSNNTGNVRIYGNLSYYCGNDTSPKGHGFYLQHDDQGDPLIGGELICEGNVSFNHFGACLQSYASSGSGDQTGIKVRRNILFGANELATSTQYDTMNIGSDVASDPTKRCEVKNNLLLNAAGGRGLGHMELGHTGDPIDGLDVQDNTLINGGLNTATATVKLQGAPNTGIAGAFTFKGNFVHVGATGNRRVVQFDPANSALQGVDWDLNEIIRDPTASAWRHSGGTATTFSGWKTATGEGANDTATATEPTTTEVLYFPIADVEGVDDLSAKRGHLAYLNWGSLSQIPVDLAELGYVNGDAYEIHDVRDPWGTAVVSGTYSGGTVNVPNTQVADPAVVGGAPNTPTAIAPFSNAFVVRKTN